MKTLAALFFLGLALLPAAVPDGKWNGKPWDLKILEAGVEKGEADALAEWAYCSYHVYLGLEFDRELCEKRAEAAREKGSLFGKALWAYFLLESLEPIPIRATALPVLKEVAQEGHPWAGYLLMVENINGVLVEKKTEGSLAALEASLEAGVMDSLHTLGEVWRTGALGEINLERAAAYWTRGLTEQSDGRIACSLYPTRAGQEDPVVRNFTAETLEEVIRRTGEMAELNHPEATYAIGFHHLKNRNQHVGIPMVIEAANLGSASAIEFFVSLASMSYFRPADYTAGHFMLSGYQWHCYDQAIRLVRAGHASTYTKRVAANSIFDRQEKIEITDLDREAIQMIHEVMLANPNHPALYHEYAGFYFSKYSKFRPDPTWIPTFVALYEYNAGFDISSAYMLARVLMAEKLPCYDRTRGMVASEYTLSKIDHPGSNQQAAIQQTKKWIARTKPKLTEEEKIEVERLRAEGYPAAEKFYRPVFEHLKEEGILPKNLPLQKTEEELEKEEESGEEVRNPQDRGRTLMALLLARAGLLTALPAEAEPNTTVEMLAFLLGDGNIPENRRAELVRFVWEERDKLVKALKDTEDPDFKTRAEAILGRLKDEKKSVNATNRLQVSLDWFLHTDSETKMLTSDPMISVVGENGPGEKAGLGLNDIVFKCEGLSATHPDSRNRLARVIAVWPAHTPLALEIGQPINRFKPGLGVQAKKMEVPVTLNFEVDPKVRPWGS